MYKTIRHGENSLQYTILPQSDDFRIEGKLTSAESNNCSSSSGSGSASSRKSKSKRPRRRSFFAYLGLIFVCTVIVGAVLIPFFFTLPNLAEWFMDKHGKTGGGTLASQLKGRGSYGYISSSPYGSYINGNGINVGKTVKIINKAGVEKIILRVNKTSNGNENEKNILSTNSNLTAIARDQQNLTVGNAGTKKANNLNNNSNNENSNPQPTVEHQFVTEVRFEPVDAAVPSSIPLGIVPTIVVTTLRNHFSNNEFTNGMQQQQLQLPTKTQNPEENPQATSPQIQAQTAPNIRPTTTFSASSQNLTLNGHPATLQNSTLMTRIIQVPLLKSAAKKPIAPPFVVKANTQLTAKGINISKSLFPAISRSTTSAPDLPGVPSVINDVDSNGAGGPAIELAQDTDWIHEHWPFVDPSTFQWTGYKAEDSVLLPALLGFALIGIVLIITVCMVARNKRIVPRSSVRRRNRNVSDIEENGTEDNTTLLTTTNLSDED